MEKVAFKWLMQEKAKRSCGEKLHYTSLKMQSYLTNPQLNLAQKKLLFQLKCTVSNVSINNPISTKYVLCPFGCRDEADCQRHMLDCPHQAVNEVESDIKYEDIYSHNTEKQTKIIQLYHELFKRRDSLLQYVRIV